MAKTSIPQGYSPLLSIYETQKAIGLLKRLFEDRLSGALRLHRVSAPLFVAASSGLNDDLNGVERPVSFDIRGVGDTAVVVHSLAKWKRLALKRYQFHPGEGLYTDMNSAYVDQWDWEKIITEEDRNTDYLKDTVRSIVGALRDTQAFLRSVFPQLSVLPEVPEEVTFVSSQELEDLYPGLTPKERENAFVKEHPVTFLMGIGGKLKSGQPHDGRAPDYDDWNLNGDLLCWDSVNGQAIELSSMGIRVSPQVLDKQLTLAGCDARRELPFHKMLLNGQLPLTMGGGIGQSRLSMLLLCPCCSWARPTLEKCRCPCGMRTPWRPAARRGSSCCKFDRNRVLGRPYGPPRSFVLLQQGRTACACGGRRLRRPLWQIQERFRFYRWGG